MVWMDHPKHIPLRSRKILVSEEIPDCPMAIAQCVIQECWVLTVLGRTKYPSIPLSDAHSSIASSVSFLGVETAISHQ